MVRMIASIGAVSLCAGVALAGPTGLNAIPTADVLGHRELYVSYAFGGTERKISTKIDQAGGGLIGLGDRVELGWDTDFEGTSVFNLKVQMLQGSNWAVSGGYMELRQGESQSYLVGSFDMGSCCKGLRLHGGWLEDGKSRLMLGMDYALTDDIVLMADSISGKDGMTFVGFNAPVFGLKGFDVTVSGGIPHTRSDGYTWGVTIGYGVRF